MPRRVLAAAAVIAALNGTALADPVIVTSGAADAHEGDSTFLFAGAGFRFSGEAPGSLGDALGDCGASRRAPGDAVGLSDRFQPQVSASTFDSATYAGRTYERVALTGDLFLEAGTLIVPDVPLNTFVTLTAPFSFRGILSGYDSLALSGTPLFTTALRGAGLASLNFTNSAETGLQASRVTYEFQPTDPVPEPASLILFGSGLAGAAAARRRRQHASNRKDPCVF